MKTRNHRKTSSKTRKQYGGGVHSKPKKNLRNMNFTKYVTISSLDPRNQLAYYAIRRKLEERRKELAELEAYRESSTVARRASNNIETKKARLRDEINSLLERSNVVTTIPHIFSGYSKENLGTIKGKLYTENPQTGENEVVKEEIRPVLHDRFKISPEFGQVSPFGSSDVLYTNFQKLLLQQIFILRREAFPEEYGETSEEFNELLLGIFGKGPMSSKIVSGKHKSVVNPYTNAEHILFIPPMHCEARKGTMSNINFIDSLYFYFEDDLKRMRANKSILYRYEAQPHVISSCAYTFCRLPSGLSLVELVGVATFEKYQGQGFAGKMLMKLFNFLSSIGSTNIKIGKGEVSSTSEDSVDYVWLYFDRTKPYLGEFYKKFGFQVLTDKETDPELKQIYIGREYLLTQAREKKWANFKEEAEAKHRKITREPLQFINEEDFDAWAKRKKEKIYNTFVPKDYRTGEILKNKQGNPIPDNFTKKTLTNFGGDVEKYKQAIFDDYISRPVYKVVILTKQLKKELNTLTEEEEYNALKFERENVQMVLSMADWVYEMNKLTKL